MKQTGFILLFALLTACAGMTVDKAVGYTTNAATIVTSIRYLDKHIDSTVSSIYDSKFYTVDEQVLLDRLFTDIDFVINRIEAIVDREDVHKAVFAASDVEMLLVSSRNIYSEMYVIVSAHYTEYPPEVQLALVSLNENLLAIDRAWNEISKTPDGRDITPIISGALKVIDGGVKVSRMVAAN